MGQCHSPSISPSRQSVSSTVPPQEELSLFQLYLQDGNPFEMHIDHKEEETEDVLASNGVGVENGLSEKKKDDVLVRKVKLSTVVSTLKTSVFGRNVSPATLDAKVKNKSLVIC